jgi:hypothetical protein
MIEQNLYFQKLKVMLKLTAKHFCEFFAKLKHNFFISSGFVIFLSCIQLFRLIVLNLNSFLFQV